MAFKAVTDLSTDVTVSLGGFNKKLKKDNPTSIEGYYLGRREVADNKKKSGVSYIYILQTPKGNVGVWGKTDMDRKMTGATLGHMLRITHTGMQPTANGEMYKYKVEFDADNTIEVTELSEGSSTAPAEDFINDTADYDGATYTHEDTVDEDAVQAQALAAAEQKAKVQALLNRNKRPVAK